MPQCIKGSKVAKRESDTCYVMKFNKMVLLYPSSQVQLMVLWYTVSSQYSSPLDKGSGQGHRFAAEENRIKRKFCSSITFYVYFKPRMKCSLSLLQSYTTLMKKVVIYGCRLSARNMPTNRELINYSLVLKNINVLQKIYTVAWKRIFVNATISSYLLIYNINSQSKYNRISEYGSHC